jgi:5-enolpyruvylshikimate-3-phosphate synthase
MTEVYRVTTTEGDHYAFEKTNPHGLSTITFLPPPKSESHRRVLTGALREKARKARSKCR